MSQQIINVGNTANDGTGDHLRVGGQKINANFTELYGMSGSGTVTSVAWTTSQGVSASIANSTTTPNITITLGALTGITSLNGLVITANTGVITTGTWNGTAIDVAHGGTGASTFTQGSIVFAGASGVYTQDNANFFWNSTNHWLGIGNAVPAAKLHIAETLTTTARGALIDQYSTGTNGSRISLRKSRGTFGSPGVIVTGDALGSWTAEGYDSSAFVESAKILVTSTGTISVGVVSSTMALQTMTAAGALTTAILINEAQQVTLAAGSSNVVIAGNQTITAGTNNLNLRSTAGNTVYIGHATGNNDLYITQDTILNRTILGRRNAGGILQIFSNASVVGGGVTGSILFDIATPSAGTYGNYGFNVSALPSFGGGEKVIFYGPAVTNPSTAVSSGGVFFVKSSDNLPYWRTASTEYSMTVAAGVGTVTSVAWTTSQGVSASIANSTTTPNITITLGALTGVTSFNGLVVTANTGVITTGTWSATTIGADRGGTGVANNAASTLTISGNFATTFTVSGTTGVTLPTSGTLATTANTYQVGSGATLTAANVITGTSTNTFQLSFASLGVTQVDGAGVWVRNPTAAALGAQQVSPSLVMEGQGWATGVNNSQSVRFKFDILPVQAATNPLGTARISYSVNGAAYVDAITISTSGAAVTMSSLSASSFGGWTTSSSVSAANNATSGTINTELIQRAFAPPSGTATFSSINITGTINASGGANGQVTGIIIANSITAVVNYLGLDINPTTPSNISGNNWGVYVRPTAGLSGFGITPSALVTVGAGSTTILPFKMTSGPFNTTASAGVAEYDGINLAFTPSGTTRKIVSAYQLGRSTAQTAANASVATWTVGANDGTFLVSANVLPTTSTTHAFTVTCSYTDESNTARVVTMSFSQLAGTFTTSIANTGGTVPYEGVPLQIRCKAATTITIGTTGTFTSVTYNVEGSIAQIN